jgi:beta-fructofuranosidase
LFHFAPAIGWMNDPNGLIHWNGRHHLFYQHNPASPVFGSIGWGHASSADLISWQEHPEALRPGSDGTNYDANGCYSGCAIADNDDGVTLIYTGVDGTMQLPCRARSTESDLLRFEKDADNPIIRQRPGPEVLAFRDHSVRRQAGKWHQAIGGKTYDRGGTIFGYTSTDLREWTLDRAVLDASSCDIPDGTWECPDLFDAEAGTVLILSLMDDETQGSDATDPIVWYATGEWIDGRLNPDTTSRLDYGDRLYAPQSYWAADRRRIQFGWIRTDLDAAPLGDSVGVMSAPRELELRENGQLGATPARELHVLRDTAIVVGTALGHTSTTIELPRPSNAVEVSLDDSDAAITAIRLVDDRSGDMFRADLTKLPRQSDYGGAAVTLLFDHGIVEVFRAGLPATWTDLTHTTVTSIVVDHAPTRTRTDVTCWPLRPVPTASQSGGPNHVVSASGSPS